MILGIYCAGGRGREVLELVRRVDRWEQVVFIDDGCTAKTVSGIPVLPFQEFCALAPKECLRAVVATGETVIVKKLSEKITAEGIQMETIIDPSVYVPASCQLGQGVMVQRDVILAADCVLKDCAYIDFKSILTHDVCVDRFANVSLGCVLAGHVYIGEASYIGAGVTIRDEVTIGNNTIIGIGSVVTKDIPDHVVAYGYPCKVVRENQDGVIFR